MGQFRAAAVFRLYVVVHLYTSREPEKLCVPCFAAEKCNAVPQKQIREACCHSFSMHFAARSTYIFKHCVNRRCVPAHGHGVGRYGSRGSCTHRHRSVAELFILIYNVRAHDSILKIPRYALKKWSLGRTRHCGPELASLDFLGAHTAILLLLLGRAGRPPGCPL